MKKGRQSLAGVGCTFTPLTQSGSSYTFTADCLIQGVKRQSKSVITVASDSAYTVDVGGAPGRGVDEGASRGEADRRLPEVGSGPSRRCDERKSTAVVWAPSSPPCSSAWAAPARASWIGSRVAQADSPTGRTSSGPLTSFVSIDTVELDQHKLRHVPAGNRLTSRPSTRPRRSSTSGALGYPGPAVAGLPQPSSRLQARRRPDPRRVPAGVLLSLAGDPPASARACARQPAPEHHLAPGAAAEVQRLPLLHPGRRHRLGDLPLGRLPRRHPAARAEVAAPGGRNFLLSTLLLDKVAPSSTRISTPTPTPP